MDRSCCFSPFFFYKIHINAVFIISIRLSYFALKLKLIQFIFHSFWEKILLFGIKNLFYFYCLSMKIDHLFNIFPVKKKYIQLSCFLPWSHINFNHFYLQKFNASYIFDYLYYCKNCFFDFFFRICFYFIFNFE